MKCHNIEHYIYKTLQSSHWSLYSLHWLCLQQNCCCFKTSYMHIHLHYLVNCCCGLLKGRKNLNSLRKCDCFQALFLSFPTPHFFIQAQFDLTWFDLSPATFSLNKVTKSYLLGETRASLVGRFDEFLHGLKILTLLYSNVTHDYKDLVFDEVYEM